MFLSYSLLAIFLFFKIVFFRIIYKDMFYFKMQNYCYTSNILFFHFRIVFAWTVKSDFNAIQLIFILIWSVLLRRADFQHGASCFTNFLTVLYNLLHPPKKIERQIFLPGFQYMSSNSVSSCLFRWFQSNVQIKSVDLLLYHAYILFLLAFYYFYLYAHGFCFVVYSRWTKINLPKYFFNNSCCL